MGFFSRDTVRTTTVETSYIDPVTGRTLSTNAPTTTSTTSTSAQPIASTSTSTSSSHPVSHNTTKITTPSHTNTEININIRSILMGTAAVAVIGGLVYGGYRYYQKYQLKKKLDALSSAEHSAFPLVVVDDPAELDQIINEVENRKKLQTRVFILVEGAKEGPNNESWCDDCVRAEPIIRQVFEENCDKVILIEAPVKRSDYKGNTQHPYRTHPELKVSRIPTLYKWQDGHVVDALVESELFDMDRVRRFVR